MDQSVKEMYEMIRNGNKGYKALTHLTELTGESSIAGAEDGQIQR